MVINILAWTPLLLKAHPKTRAPEQGVCLMPESGSQESRTGEGEKTRNGCTSELGVAVGTWGLCPSRDPQKNVQRATQGCPTWDRKLPLIAPHVVSPHTWKVPVLGLKENRAETPSGAGLVVCRECKEQSTTARPSGRRGAARGVTDTLAAGVISCEISVTFTLCSGSAQECLIKSTSFFFLWKQNIVFKKKENNVVLVRSRY